MTLRRSVVRIIILICFVSVTAKTIFAQPYYCRIGPEYDSTKGNSVYPVKIINLSTGQNNLLLERGYVLNLFDQSQSWVANGEKSYTIRNVNDTSRKFYVWQVDHMLYSQIHNKLYIFGPYDEFLEKSCIYVIDALTFETDSTIEFSRNFPKNDNMFFSADEKTVYFTLIDSNYSVDRFDKEVLFRLDTYSYTVSQGKYLSEMGYPNTDGSVLYQGYNGKGIIASSKWNPVSEKFYRVYDLLKDTGSAFVYNRGAAKPFIGCSGKYLVLAEQGFDTTDGPSVRIYYTGKIKIFDVATARLIKQLSVPQRSKILHFDKFSNMIYVVPEDSLDFYHININIDTIINTQTPVAILPSLTFPGVGAFSMQVNGKGFSNTSKVLWNGSPRQTHFVSDSVVTADILAADVASVGSFGVSICSGDSLNVISDSLLFKVVNKLPKPIHVLSDKVTDNLNNTFKACYGYNNLNTESVYIPVGTKNCFTTDPVNRRQTTVFLPGKHENTFSIQGKPGEHIYWNLAGEKVEANTQSNR